MNKIEKKIRKFKKKVHKMVNTIGYDKTKQIIDECLFGYKLIRYPHSGIVSVIVDSSDFDEEDIN